jgi:hypothetical protein
MRISGLYGKVAVHDMMAKINKLLANNIDVTSRELAIESNTSGLVI